MTHRTLEINVISAKVQQYVNLVDKMDVYAIISLKGGNSQKQKTKTPVDKDCGKDPTWNFPVKFTIDESLAHNNHLNLRFKIKCYKILEIKELGQVNVPVMELLDSPGEGNSMKFVSYQVRKSSGKLEGTLNFSYKFGDKVSELLKPEKTKSGQHFTANPSHVAAGSSSAPYPHPHGPYPPYHPPGYGYPPQPVSAAYGGYPPRPIPAAYGGYPPQAPSPGYGYRPSTAYGGYPPQAPPPSYGYGPPPPGYRYPSPGGYGYPPFQKPSKGARLVSGVLDAAAYACGLLIGDMVFDAAAYDGAADDGGFFIGDMVSDTAAYDSEVLIGDMVYDAAAYDGGYDVGFDHGGYDYGSDNGGYDE